MRNALATLFLIVAACGSVEEPGGMTNGAAAPAAGEPDNRIECRIGAAQQYERFCSSELADTAEGKLLTIRKPDGGFRRLLVTRDGRGVVAADGAERAKVTILGDERIEVEIGSDRFRLPATVRRR